jgi:hypothetical protein
MKRFAIIVAIISFSAIAKDDYPGNWQGFKESPLPEDKKLVSNILKAGEKSHYDLCLEYGRGERAKKETRRNRAIFEFLLHSKSLNTADLSNIKERNVSVGMTACGVMAALGKPTRGHTRESAYGISTQMVYERDGHYNTYVHLDYKNSDFIVTSISR